MKKILSAVLSAGIVLTAAFGFSASAQGTNYFVGDSARLDECACKITTTNVNGTTVYDVTNMSSTIGFPNLAVYDACKNALEASGEDSVTLIAAFDARMDFVPGTDVATAHITLRNWDFNKSNIPQYEALDAKGSRHMIFYPPADESHLVIKLQKGVQFTSDWQTYAVQIEVGKEDFQEGAGKSWGLSIDNFANYASVTRAQIRNCGIYLESEYEESDPQETDEPTPTPTQAVTPSPTATANTATNGATEIPKTDESGFYTLDENGKYVAVSNADIKTMADGTTVYRKNGDKYEKGQIVTVNGEKGFKADSSFNPLFIIIPVAVVVVAGAVIAVIVIKKKKQ